MTLVRSAPHHTLTPLLPLFWTFPLLSPPLLHDIRLPHDKYCTDPRAHSTEDERSIANRLAKETEEGEPEDEKSREAELGKIDPTLPAKSHGNQPSKGALIDKEIQDEEAESKFVPLPEP